MAGVPLVSSNERTLQYDLLELIDTSIQRILLYLSATNWQDMYPQVLDILKTVQNTRVEDPYLLPKVEIISTLYLDTPKLALLLKDVLSVVTNIKRPVHLLTIEFFLQKAVMYWISARPIELAKACSEGSALVQTAVSLFDVFYSATEESKRPLSSYCLLGLLLAFNSPVFEEDEATSPIKSKVRPFMRHPNKRQAFLAPINALAAAPQPQISPRVIAACVNLIRVGAILSVFAPSNPLCSYVRNLYPMLLQQLYPSPPVIHPTSISLLMMSFQSSFVACYSVLLPELIFRDVFRFLDNPQKEYFCYVPNILQGLINVRNAPMFSKQYKYVMDTIYTTLRSLIADAHAVLLSYETNPNASKDPMTVSLHKSSIKIVKNCFTIYALDPEYIIRRHDYNPVFDKDPLFLIVTYASLSTNEEIQSQALDFCWSFLEERHLQSLGSDDVATNPSSPVYASFVQFGSLAESFAQVILTFDQINERCIKYLELIKRLLEGRHALITTYHLEEICERDPTKIEPRACRESVSKSLEITMYICLLSNNMIICKLAFDVLQCLVQEAILIEDISNTSKSAWSILPNFAMHSEFSSSSYVLTGTVAVQKRLFQFLQHLQVATPAIISTWKTVYDKWRTLSQQITNDLSLDRDKIKQWRSHSGLLCSLLSPWLVMDGEKAVEGNLSKTSKNFLVEMMGFLTDKKSPFLRETARDILSRDTSHLSYHFIFKTIEQEVVTRISNTPNSLAEQDFLLLEQCVMLLRSVIGIINAGGLYLSTDIGALALTIVKCLDSIPGDERTIRLRVQYCHLVELITDHKDTLNMKQDITIRNEIATIFAGWLDKCLATRFTGDTESVVSGSTSNRSSRRRELEYERLQKELICSVLQSFTVILLDLRLAPHESQYEKDTIDAKAHKFGILFTLFLRVLEKCRYEEDGKSTGGLALGDRLLSVKSNTIECASKLLNSNMDVGLKFALPLGFKDDSFIRVSFIKILDNILTHRSEEFVEETEIQLLQELAEFMMSNINITLSLCDVCPATGVDEFANALIKIFDAQGKCLVLVKAVVTREIERADSIMEILRRNCVATKILSIYAHMKGVDYLKLTLVPFLDDLVANSDIYAFETNPEKLQDSKSREANFKNFNRSFEKLLEALNSTVNEVPSVLREICNTIRAAAGSKFPTMEESSVTAVSSFFFLRFICPALVSPESDGLLEAPPSKEIRRTLLALAKKLQNMAFGSAAFSRLTIFKLQPANFMPDSSSVIQVLRAISEYPKDAVPDDQLSLTSDIQPIEAGDIDVLHKFLYHHWEDINHKMLMDQRLSIIQNGNKSNITSDEQDHDYLRVSHRLTSLIRNLGRPRALNTANSKVSASMQATGVPDADLSVLQTVPRLKEFMSRNSRRDMRPVIDRHIFTEGVDKDGVPLLVISASNFNRNEVDSELTLCRFFQVACKMWRQKFAFFYDATGFTFDNLFPTKARDLLSLMVPEQMVKNCSRVYVLNSSTELLPALKGHIKQHYSGFFLNPLRVEYVFLTSADIGNNFNLSTLNLNPRTLRLLQDVRIIFNNVYRFNPLRNEMRNVSIKLGNEFVQIRSQEPFTYIKSSPGYSNDIFALQDIVDVYKSDTDGHPDEYTIELYGEPDHRKIIIHCSRGHEIMRAILNAKSRLPTETNVSAQVISPETSISSLLNIALSGLCSESATIQEASYNLMASIQHRFGFDLGMELHGGKGLRLPANVFSRVKMFSTAIARDRPDLTADMLHDMFLALQATSVDRRQGVLMYAIPWVKNISSYLMIDEHDKNHDATKSIIRKFLDISIDGSRDYMFLLQSVWPIILQEYDLIPIVIDEIVFLLIDNGIYSGVQLDDTVAILTSMPSIDVCSHVMARVRDISLASGNLKGISLPQHPKWQEFVILITILSGIIFENPAVSEEFFSQLSLCILNFLHTGPYSFRKTLYNMMANLMHSFLYSPSCNEEQRAHVRTIWKDLTGSKGNMIFGTSDELRYVDFDYPVTSLTFQFEACCNILNDLSSSVLPARMQPEKRNYFVQKCLEMGTAKFSVFQARALLMLGCSSRVEIEDNIVSRVLLVLHDGLVELNSPARDDLLICIMFSISKLADGLHLNSRYVPRLFWLAVAVLGSCNMKIFGFALQLLQTTLKNLDQYGAFRNTSIADYLMTAREEFESEWQALEKVTQICFTRDYFEIALTATLLRGLEKSTTQAATLATFDLLLSVASRNTGFGRTHGSTTTGVLREKASNASLLNGIASGRLNSPSVGSLGSPLSSIPLSLSTQNFHSGFNPTLRAIAANDADDMATVSSTSMHFASYDKEFPSYMPYLFILYLRSRLNTELQGYLWQAGFSESFNEDDIPSRIKAFLCSDDRTALLTMYLGTQVFRICENEEMMELRVLSCLRHMGMSRIDSFFRVYFVAREKIKWITDCGPSMTVLKAALETSRCALMNISDLKRKDYYISEMDTILIKAGLKGLTSPYLGPFSGVDYKLQLAEYSLSGDLIINARYGNQLADLVKKMVELEDALQAELKAQLNVDEINIPGLNLNGDLINGNSDKPETDLNRSKDTSIGNVASAEVAVATATAQAALETGGSEGTMKSRPERISEEFIF